jgi:putative membrane protein insertion efficiency factor
VASLVHVLFTAPIRLYQRFVSPMLGPRCRYYPTCSDYAVRSIERFGILRGSVLAAWRLLRCNPLSCGGFDYPEDQRLFSSRGPASHTP